jgi:hypothetical protein
LSQLRQFGISQVQTIVVSGLKQGDRRFWVGRSPSRKTDDPGFDNQGFDCV